MQKPKRKANSRFMQGQFIPSNPKKYLGDPTKIEFRSSWELKCMKNFDLSQDIVAWNSEDVKIKYIHPKDGLYHTYFMDFLIVDKNKKVHLIEVKPYKETVPPKPQGKKKARYLKECLTYEINQAKWAYARKYCQARGWNFVILTEKSISNLR